MLNVDVRFRIIDFLKRRQRHVVRILTDSFNFLNVSISIKYYRNQVNLDHQYELQKTLIIIKGKSNLFGNWKEISHFKLKHTKIVNNFLLLMITYRRYFTIAKGILTKTMFVYSMVNSIMLNAPVHFRIIDPFKRRQRSFVVFQTYYFLLQMC